MTGVIIFVLKGLLSIADYILDTWGHADIVAGVAAIKDWIKNVQWDGPSVDVCEWLVSGHSNGGRFYFPLEAIPLTESRSGDMAFGHA